MCRAIYAVPARIFRRRLQVTPRHHPWSSSQRDCKSGSLYTALVVATLVTTPATGPLLDRSETGFSDQQAGLIQGQGSALDPLKAKP